MPTIRFYYENNFHEVDLMVRDSGRDGGSTESFKDWITYPRGWWALIFVLPFLRFTVGPLQRNTWIEPNHITIFSFLTPIDFAPEA